MWKKYNNNPCQKSVGDCAVRAVAVALGISWNEAFDLLVMEARLQCDLPSSDAVWGGVLEKSGFSRHVCRCGTAAEFCRDHPNGIYVLAFGGHVATVRHGTLFDSWDSTNEKPIYFYRGI